LDALPRSALSETDPRALRDYALLAPVYDRLWAKYVGVSVRRTLDLLRLEGDERLLDVGCGTGVLLGALARTRSRMTLVGLDPSRAMLAQARARLGSSAALDLGVATKLPYRDGAFDAVVSTSVLHAFPGPREAILAEWGRVLAPGGRLALTDWRAGHWGTATYNALLALAGRRQHPLVIDTVVAELGSVGLGVEALEEFHVDAWGLVSVLARKAPSGPGPGAV
jgi:ubiquinone/menaquinone biosynthesis C-methylase UbiE